MQVEVVGTHAVDDGLVTHVLRGRRKRKRQLIVININFSFPDITVQNTPQLMDAHLQ